MNIIPSHLVERYEQDRGIVDTFTTEELGAERVRVENALTTANGNAADYLRVRLHAVDDELAERTDGVRYDLYTRAGKAIR